MRLLSGLGRDPWRILESAGRASVHRDHGVAPGPTARPGRGSPRRTCRALRLSHITGAGQARNRVRRAVERTVPFALLVQTLVVLWSAGHGNPAADLAAARTAAPWYTTKREPAYADMHASLRRTIIAARFSPATVGPPTDDEIRAVLAAWAAAEPALTA